MSESVLGELIYPRHCRVSVSADKKQFALTFQGEDRTPLTIVLPMAGAVGLQRKLAQSLYILGVRPVAAEAAPAGEPESLAS
jgi:hypothetical protein